MAVSYTHLDVYKRQGYALPDTVSRCVRRFLLQQQGILEKGITQELIVFPRDYIDAAALKSVVCPVSYTHLV